MTRPWFAPRAWALALLCTSAACDAKTVIYAAQSVYHHCGRRLDYVQCEPLLWKNDRELAGRFMGRYEEQVVILGSPLLITYHPEERRGTDGKGDYVETFSTLSGPNGRTFATLRFARAGERLLLTQFTFEPKD